LEGHKRAHGKITVNFSGAYKDFGGKRASLVVCFPRILPQGQGITADEIAYLAAFLASPKSIAINGDSIAAGGGSPGAIHY
jgi:hypothetical protein